MPTKNRPKVKMRPFSREHQSMILLFLADRLTVNQYALMRCIELWDVEKNSFTTQSMLHHKGIESAIKWLMSSLPECRTSTKEQLIERYGPIMGLIKKAKPQRGDDGE